ncbi:MAG TPA: UDP-N-acetylmuramoyl-tripeptide--D-alanyl-D-alanine ligase [Phycisphaerae bacterium]|nr:UDP-N-acetylmuramoyl-tripeptide--D-alanyl-D-alanine ligase [Phycisphaerae bacterium]
MKPLMLQEMAAAMSGRVYGEVTSPRVKNVCTDTRSLQDESLFFAIKGENFDGHDFVAQALEGGATAAVVKDARRFDEKLRAAGRLVEVDDTILALGRLAGWYRRQIPAEVIAVLGSNGKTTTKDMIHAVLSSKKSGKAAAASFNNAVGVPLTLLSVEPSDQYVVVEMGTNHPGEIAQLARIALPDMAVVTSIGEEHLEGFGDISAVAAEEFSFLPYLEGRAFVAVSDQAVTYAPTQSKGQTARTMIVYGLSETADVRATDLKQTADSLSFRVNGRSEFRISLLGAHNVVNALAAIAIGNRFRLENADIALALSTCKGPKMRMQARQIGSLYLINDAYNANPASMRVAMDAMDNLPRQGRRVLILGDMRELGNQSTRCHQRVGRDAGSSSANVIIAVGSMARVMADGATSAAGMGKRIYPFPTVDALANKLPDLLEPGDNVLLKASRGTQLERLVPIIEKCGQAVAT